MRAAGVPNGVGFATKPTLALNMIVRALDAGTPARWVIGCAVYGGEVYGADPRLQTELHRRQVGYVLRLPATVESEPPPARSASPRSPT